MLRSTAMFAMFMVACLTFQSLHSMDFTQFISKYPEANDAQVEKFIWHYLIDRENLSNSKQLLDVWCEEIQKFTGLVSPVTSRVSLTQEDKKYTVAWQKACCRYIEASCAAERVQNNPMSIFDQSFLRLFAAVCDNNPPEVRNCCAAITSCFCEHEILPVHRRLYTYICNYALVMECKLLLDIMKTYKDNFEYEIYQDPLSNDLIYKQVAQ